MSAPEPQTFSHFPNLPPPVRVRLTTLPAHACAYLPDRQSTFRAFAAESIDSSVYHRFLDANFRRSGTMVYQPVCDGCRQCVSIRVPVDRFAPTRSQRRSSTRNRDLRVAVGSPVPSEEKYALYARYASQWHARGLPTTIEDFVDFLYCSPTRTIEFAYRDAAGTLLGVGICDVSAASLSSVYFYFEPAAADRSLGTFAAVREIAFAREASIPFYHLGYWIAECPAMAYKANFRPAEVLQADGVWRPLES